MTTGYIPTLAQVDELHRKIAQSQAAYDLIHGHCVVVADIARRIQDEMTYPGQVKITVIRETRSVSYAK